MSRDTPRKLIASNKRARHEYEILKTYEAGLVLLGTEVKSLRLGQASLVDAFAQERDGELHLYGLHIAEYGIHGFAAHGPRRIRKLLLHRAEIDRILDKIREPGLSLIPLALYFKGSVVKVELGLVTNKKQHDKRQASKEADDKREMDRAVKRAR